MDMKKITLMLCLCLLALGTQAQTAESSRQPFKPVANELTPTVGTTFDFSPEAIKAFEAEDNEMFVDIYDILGMGCSFYCGCQSGEISTSSELAPQGKYDYKAANMHDLSYKTAWVEGREGYGEGEWVEYKLPPTNPRITEFYVANGLIRTKKAWQENSRVKTLAVTVNGQPFTTLHLDDVYAEQRFDVGEIGYPDRQADLQAREPIVIRFTILEVYPGTKYKDTAITEIYFNGIDVH